MSELSYQPREGVDYLVDLYAVANVPPGAPPEDVKRALDTQTMAYHPDRLQGVAPEFQEKGERITRLLNRARGVLLDDDNRAAYDQLLQEWQGPVSTDGAPAIEMESYVRKSLATQGPNAVSALFAERDQRAILHTGHQEGVLAFMEQQVAQHPTKEGREALEALLVQKERMLAIQQAGRLEIFGIDPNTNDYRIGEGHAEQIGSTVEAAREQLASERQAIASGRFGARLALLAGEEPLVSEALVSRETTAEPDASEPAYMQPLAEQIKNLAEERESIFQKRLANIIPHYPLAPYQETLWRDVIIGIHGESANAWLGFRLDNELVHADNFVPTDEAIAALNAGNYLPTLLEEYNIITTMPLENIDLQTLTLALLQKHADNLRAKQRGNHKNADAK